METLSAFVLFALVAGFTPGPNNLMLATSGVNFGLRRTLPHMFGVVFGFPLMFAGVGAGLGGLFITWPWLQTGLQLAGSLYLAWLAWKIALAPAVQGGDEAGRPLGFWQAAAFQWVNPKGWMMVITAITLYTVAGEGYYHQIGVMTLIGLLVSFCSSSTWTLLGTGIRRIFENRPRLHRAFNIVMGLLLILSILPILLS